MKSALRYAVILGMALCVAAEAAELPKIGFYARSLGARSCRKAMSADKSVRVGRFKPFKLDELLKYDAVVIGACSLGRPDYVKAIRVYVGCGGGIVFNHNSCGRRRPETLFPSVVQKVSGRREDTIVRVKDAAHPIAAGLPKEFEHAYYDHMLMAPGPDGKVVIVDREGSPVTVAGPVGPGRVVFNGTVPGYWYDAATYWQGERLPQGAERTLIGNAAKWAAGGRVTQLPKAELAARRKKIESEIRIADLEKLLPTSEWFATEMLYGSYMPRPPVHELGGRYFITYDRQTWRGYGMRRTLKPEQIEFFRNRLRIDVRRLKWLGVTDIMLWTDVSGENVSHPTSLPDSKRQYASVDPLAELIKAATPEGLNVWAAWHSCFRYPKTAAKYCGKDAQGKLYTYTKGKYCEDLLSPVYRKRCHDMLDEYATKYKPMGNFKGLACYDELWFTYADFHGDDFDKYAAFCKERFGETPTPDVAKRIQQRRQWNDTSDVWRRRYILFKQQVMLDFWRDLVSHAHKRDMQIGLQLLSTAFYSSGWSWGMDSVRLAQLPADFFNTSCGKVPAASYPNTYRWAHVHGGWGLYNTHCLRGGPGGMYFTFNQLWRPLMYANNPDVSRQFARHIHMQREWSNGQSLTRVAVLHNQNTVQMLLKDPRNVVSRSTEVLRVLQRGQDGDMIYARAPEQYGRFRVLVATPYTVRGLPGDAMRKLKQFVERGGVVISVDADWSVSRADLTRESDVTEAMVGVRYGKPVKPAAVKLLVGKQAIRLDPSTPRRTVTVLPGVKTLASFDKGGAAITENTLGKGRVIGVHFDAGAEMQKTSNKDLAALLIRTVREASRPAVYAEGKGFRVINALRKGNWVAVALYPDETPSTAKLRVDMKALGIKKTRFRMLMLGKRLEIARPGDMWGDGGFWTSEDLKKGFTVTIAADNDRYKPLPEKFDLSPFDRKVRSSRLRKHLPLQKAYIKNITRGWWDSPSRGKRKRTYAHEIVVLAPADEAMAPK